MSNELAKYLNSRRRHRDEAAIRKQTKIAKQHNTGGYTSREVNQPHRLNKRHAMDCGNPQCGLCGNPRRTHKEKTIQEQRFDQPKIDSFDSEDQD